MKNKEEIPPSNPFIYGKIVRGVHFFNRTKEKQKLLKLLRGQSNVLIMGDRRIGKTSLLLECLRQIEEEGTPTFYLNLDPITSATDFVERFGGLFTQQVSFAKRAFLILKAGLQGFRLNMEVQEDGSPTASIQWAGPGKFQRKTIQEVLKLPQELATYQKKKFIVCFDEFQAVQEIEEADFIADMRSSFQHHDQVLYVFMGSEPALLNQLFSSPKEKFFNSSIKLHVGPMPRSEFIPFIQGNFSKRGVVVSEEMAAFICEWAHDIPAHIQHLCASVWDYLDLSIKELNQEVLEKAIEEDVKSRSQLYLQSWQSVGDNKDKRIIHRLAQTKNISVTNPEFCEPLGMNPATVTRRLKKILKRTRGAVIHLRTFGYAFSDPFFEEWVKKEA